MVEIGNISVKAGRKALSVIKDNGLKQESVKVVAGAAGGPKWLVLRYLDNSVFLEFFKDRKDPLYLVGSSSGSWRLAAVSQNKINDAIERFKTEYIHQQYLTKPSAEQVSRVSRHILDSFIDDNALHEILNHPFLRLSIMTVKSHAPVASENKLSQGLGLTVAFLCNAVNRKLLKFYFNRALFFDPRDIPPFSHMNDFPIERIPLTKSNLKSALLASGSIPLVMSGVLNINGAPKGVYRDGGVIDYHLDIPFLNDDDDGIVLYPHYCDRIIPGWFDKKITWRKPSQKNMDNVLLVSPSKKFLDSLPLGKIPDRNDFYLFKGRDAERISYWKDAVERSKVLGDEFLEIVESGKIKDVVKPL